MKYRHKRCIPGLNIQWPWSRLILSGKKSVETRKYPIPIKHIGKEIALIETPGPLGKKNGITSARIIGIVVFSGCFKYNSKKDWKLDEKRHRVSEEDKQFNFKLDKPTWGWEIEKVILLPSPMKAPSRRGIVFATKCLLD